MLESPVLNYAKFTRECSCELEVYGLSVFMQLTKMCLIEDQFIYWRDSNDKCEPSAVSADRRQGPLTAITENTQRKAQASRNIVKSAM